MARGEGAVSRFSCAIHIIANGSSSSIWPHRMIRQPRKDKCGRHRVLLDQQPVGVVLDFTQPTSPAGALLGYRLAISWRNWTWVTAMSQHWFAFGLAPV